MKSSDVRQKYLKYYQERGHQILPSSSLVPEGDPTTLFTGSGMQPMVPYLLGQTHPEGTRLVNSQRCFRSQDIEEIGDNRHQTFFEMLGNWSLGDYFKKDQLTWLWEFLTERLNIDPNQIYVTVFSGDEQKGIPKDTQAGQIWQQLFTKLGIEANVVEIGTENEGYQNGMQGGRIFYYDAKKNWWSRTGSPEQMPVGELGWSDSEVFYQFSDIEHDPKYGKNCHPNCDCGRFLEICNSVFIQYIKQSDSSFKELPQKNVDFGGGLERLSAVCNNQPDVFRTDLFWPIIEQLQLDLNLTYGSDENITKSLRIIADHIKAATFLIKDGVLPSNKLQGYVLKRLLRRAAVKLELLREDGMSILPELVFTVGDIYQDIDFFKPEGLSTIKSVVTQELEKFRDTLAKGLREIDKIQTIDGKKAFDLYQTYGFPLEITAELFEEKGQTINKEEFEEGFKKHQDLSRTTSAGVFKGGLAANTEETTRLHTANHLLQAALRQVLGDHVRQRGSNITAERLRFDFTHPTKVTEQELKKAEGLVNQKINEDLPIHFDIENREEAVKKGALTNYGESYPDTVKVYKIGDDNSYFSQELCGGPHVEHTGVLKEFKILKERSVAAGVRRIYAKVIS